MSIFLEGGGFEGQKFIFSVLLGTYSRKTFEDKKSNGEVKFYPFGVTIGVKSKFFEFEGCSSICLIFS